MGAADGIDLIAQALQGGCLRVAEIDGEEDAAGDRVGRSGRNLEPADGEADRSSSSNIRRLQRRDHGDGGRQRVAAVAARRGSGMGLVSLHLDREPA